MEKERAMARGVFVLLLMGVVVFVLHSLLPRRTFRKILLVGALFLIGLVLVFLLYALTRAHLSGPEWVFLFFLFAALSFLFIRGLARLFRPAPPGDRPPPGPPVGLLKDLAERLPPAEKVLLVGALFLIGLVLALLLRELLHGYSSAPAW